MLPTEFARLIDHTVLKPETTDQDIQRVLEEAKRCRFFSVCVAPIWTSRIVTALKGSGVAACSVVSFPHGTSKSTLKAIEATGAAKDGADELDVVAHLPYLASLDLHSARAELLEVVRAARAVRRDITIKVIVESAYLLSLGSDQGEAAIAVACRAVRESGCDFIKTSTGFHPAGGASVEAVKLMAKYGESLKIKASGGIRTLASAMALLDAGAHRLGLSASVTILNELNPLP